MEINPAVIEALKEKAAPDKATTSSKSIIPQNSGLVELVEWPVPIHFEKYDLPPFPVNVLSKPVRDYVGSYASFAETPVDSTAMASLMAQSFVISRKYRVKPHWEEPTNLYLAAVLPTGERKTPVLEAFIKPIRDYENEQLRELTPIVEMHKQEMDIKRKEIETLKGKMTKPKKGEPSEKKDILREISVLSSELAEDKPPTLPQFICDDATPESIADLLHENGECVAVIDSEGTPFKIMAGRYSQDAKPELYLKGYTGQPVTVNRKSNKSYVTRLKKPRITFGVFIQPTVIAELPKEFDDKGVLGRFLYSMPNSNVGYRPCEYNELDEDAKEAYSRHITKMLEDRAEEKILLFSPEAKATLQCFSLRVEKGMRPDGIFYENTMRNWAQKLVGNVARLTGLLHVSRHIENGNVPDIIQKETVTDAIKLGEYFIAHAQAMFGCMSVNADVENAKYVLGIIERKNLSVIPFQDLWQLTSKRMKTSETLRNAMTVLYDRGYARKDMTTRKEMIFINPKLSTSSTKDEENYSFGYKNSSTSSTKLMGNAELVELVEQFEHFENENFSGLVELVEESSGLENESLDIVI